MAASYPAATKTFREKENLAGLNYDSNNKRTLFVEDLTQIEDEVIAIEEELGAEVSGDAETLADRLDDMEAATAAIMSAVYPVGSIYINATNSSNPNTLLGFGTWEAWGVGRAIVGIDTGQTEFDTAEETGGSKTHTLSIDEMPAHTHTQNQHRHQPSDGQSFLSTTGNIAVNGTQRAFPATGSSGYMVYAPSPETITEPANTNYQTPTNNNTGGDGAHNNLQPYQVGYVWKRTA